jgi:hypothetical protein
VEIRLFKIVGWDFGWKGVLSNRSLPGQGGSWLWLGAEDGDPAAGLGCSSRCGSSSSKTLHETDHRVFLAAAIYCLRFPDWSCLTVFTVFTEGFSRKIHLRTSRTLLWWKHTLQSHHRHYVWPWYVQWYGFAFIKIYFTLVRTSSTESWWVRSNWFYSKVGSRTREKLYLKYGEAIVRQKSGLDCGSVWNIFCL